MRKWKQAHHLSARTENGLPRVECLEINDNRCYESRITMKNTGFSRDRTAQSGAHPGSGRPIQRRYQLQEI